MKKLCYVATIPAVVHSFLRPHIMAASKNYNVTVICNFSDQYLVSDINAKFIFLPIIRKPSIWSDLSIFLKLISLFRQERFTIVHSIMPKTGILAMSAAWFTRVPVRIHTFTGQVWATKKGLSRLLLRYFDVLIGFFSTIALTDSPSQFNFLVQNDVLPEYKLKVIGFGSICGVDAIRFQCDVVTKQRIRLELNISKNSFFLLYVGRLNKDKGLFDLAEAFNLIAELHPEVVLLLVGSEEEVKFSSLQNICHLHKERLRYIKFTAHPEHYMVASDIFCLPSYREGFGLTIIEAAACGLPSVASRIYGITDAVIEGHTGLMFPAGDVNALAFAVRKLLTDLELRLMLGENARLRAQKDFSSEAITQHMLHIYDELTTSCIV